MDDIINKILSNYNIEGYNLEIKINKYIVVCNSETFLLHSYNNKRNQLKDLIQFYEDIYSNGFRKLGKVIKTNNGNRYIKAKDKSYFLTSYFKEDNDYIYDTDFYKSSVQVLNKFHRCTIELSPEKYNLNREYSKYIKRYLKRIDYMINLKYNLSNNIVKSYIDKQVLEVLNMYDNILINCKTILNNLREIKTKNNLRYRFSTTGVKLSDFTKTNNKVRLKSIGKIKQTYYHIDLGSLLNSILTRTDVNWDYRLFEELLSEYKKDYNYTLEDIYLTLIFTIFPYNLYDICKSIYKKNSFGNIQDYKDTLNTFLSQGNEVSNWFNIYVEKNNI